uniref:hypothetical protein n=1 Tax=Mucilaginibacter sp. Bleaf8 TaxID=2834430 RepID=UPI001BCB1805|nr:hypothetical protein [Mucilaginibacter sp. Bleaf8]
MRYGAEVLALGKPGKITFFQVSSVSGMEYVYYIHVKLDGEKKSEVYHPSDVEQHPLQPAS